jgi:spectinomycin phosphotransferase
MVEQRTFDEPVAAKFAALMSARRDQIDQLVRRAEELALRVQARPLELVLCHSDVHAGNLLTGADGKLYIVDWDNPILAPKERDLMFIGGGVSASLSSARGQALFYQAYGPSEVDRVALAYYRYERIVVDIAEFCKQLLLSEAGGEDREQAYRWFNGNFLPGDTIEMALNADRDLPR